MISGDVSTKKDSLDFEAPTGNSDDLNEVLSPITLPCGRIVPNRLVKAAMYEHAASFLGGPPNALHYSLYSKWGEGNWGMVITGNVQISPSHLTLGRDTVFPQIITPKSIEPFRRISDAIHQAPGGKTLALVQISHSGRQAANVLGGRFPFFPPLAPSATRVGGQSTDGILSWIIYRILFQTAREMTHVDIDEVVEGFVRGAKVALESGFDGVQLHASHGYLLAQFMSPKTNHRKDEYGHPLRLLRRIVKEIRSAVPPTFVIGVKLNAADYVSGGLSEEQVHSQVKEIGTWAIDFMEVSGGDYENPDFMAKPSTRQAFFETFAKSAVKMLQGDNSAAPRPLVMLTGGLRTRSQFKTALRQRHADLLGLGRLSVIHPQLPCLLETASPEFLISSTPEPSPATPDWAPKIVGASVSTAWYVVAKRRIARAQGVPYNIGPVRSVLEMYLGFWDTMLLCACVFFLAVWILWM